MSFFKKITTGYSELWKAIIRPPRDEYEQDDLGHEVTRLGNMMITRTDIELVNDRNLRLQCSFFEPKERVAEQLPCVIYLHGNCSSRVEALPAVPLLLQMNVCLFCLDLSGSGQSDGQYISLGWFEREDVRLVVEYLRKTGRISTIGLWGRSMGAVTALLHGDRDPSIAGMVLDSPFADLTVLAKEIAGSYANVPNFVLSTAIKFIRKTVKKNAMFDIYDLKPIEHVKQCFIPAFFACGLQDTFIQPHHTEDLYNAYWGDKQIHQFEGDHNSNRPNQYLDMVASFFFATLQCQSLPYSERQSYADLDYDMGLRQMPGQMGQISELGHMQFDDEDEDMRRAIQESLAESTDMVHTGASMDITDLCYQRVTEGKLISIQEANDRYLNDIGF